MSADDNPYAPPSASLEISSKELVSSELRLFLRWEKLRLLYNAILLLTMVLMLVLDPIRDIRFGPLAVRLALLLFLTNVGFCLGLVIDGYAHWFGLRHIAVAVTLFVAGTLFAVFIVVGALYSLAMSMAGLD